MAENISKFLDYDGLSYLWGKIKDNFAHELKYDETTRELYMVDGLGERLESTIDTKKFGAISANNYTEVLAYAKQGNVGLVVYLTADDSTHTDGVVYSQGAYIITGDNSVMRLSASTSPGNIDDALNAISQRVGVLEAYVGSSDEDGLGLRIKNLEDSKVDSSVLENYVLSTTLETTLENYVKSGDLYTKSEIDDKFLALTHPEYTIVDNGDLTYNLTKDGEVVGATISIPKDMVVSAGEVRELTSEEITEDRPQGLYIVLTIANSTSDKLYIPANKLVDEYTSSDYITVGDDGKIELNITSLETYLNDKYAAKSLEETVQNLTTVVEGKIDASALEGYLKSEDAENTYMKKESVITTDEIDNIINQTI